MAPAFSTANIKNARFPYVDLLRGIAVLLVICRHWPINSHLANLGWLGVDLFFVISGFLITNLLFSEHEKNGTIDFTRFFIRRALKIYPLFFLLILATWLVNYFGGYEPSARPYLHELLFIQNYLGGVYLHTWSLAIEEHFYLLLLLCFAFLAPQKKKLPVVFAILIVGPLLIRLWRVMNGDAGNGDGGNHFLTHARIDSLFFGSILSYLWCYKKNVLVTNDRTRHVLLLVCSSYILSFGFALPETTYVQGIGFTLIAISCTGILMWALTTKNEGNLFTRPFSFIGYYSYSIYLLHIPVKWVLEYFGLEEQTQWSNFPYFFAYVFLCVLTGVAFSAMVEQPILRWRDKKIPSKA